MGKLVAYLHVTDVRHKEPGMGTIRKWLLKLTSFAM
jgi:hypothetical protein